MTLKNNRTHLLSNTSFVHHFIAICEFQLELRSGNGSIGSWPLWPWPLTLTFCMDITSVNGNNAWKFQNDTMTSTLSKRCDGRTDRRTDGQTEWIYSVLRAVWSQLKSFQFEFAGKSIATRVTNYMSTYHFLGINVMTNKVIGEITRSYASIVSLLLV